MICITCSGQHRGLGVQTSIVRSVSLDMWTEKQLKQLEQGGNKKLRDFFEAYNLHDCKDLKVKYQTKAADYYRRRNLALATGNQFSEPEPSVDEGRTLLNGSTLDANNQVVVESLDFAKSQLIEEEESKGPATDPTEDDKHPDSEILATQEAIMNSVKKGTASLMMGLESMRQKATTISTDEVKEGSKQIATATATAVKDGIYSGASVAKEYGSKGWEKTKEAA